MLVDLERAVHVLVHRAAHSGQPNVVSRPTQAREDFAEGTADRFSGCTFLARIATSDAEPRPRRSRQPTRSNATAPCILTALLAGLRADELLRANVRPVYGHHKQGATFGHAKIAGRALLRKGLSPLVTMLSVPQAAPVIAEAWLRSGKTGSGRGAARQVKQAVTTARGCGASGTIMLRGDSAFGTKKVISACLDEQIEFSLTLSRNKRVTKTIDSIDETEWTPVHYPGAVLESDTGALISDAEVAETPYTLNIRGHGRLTARLVVRRVKDARYPDALFPVWRYHYRLRKERFNHGRTDTETADQGCVLLPNLIRPEGQARRR